MSDEAKPAYVQFETRSIENRTATIETGHYVGEDVIFAIVTPAGSKDRVEKVAEDWIANVEEGVKQDRIPPSWLSYYKQRFEDFKASRETPEFGTPIKDWPSVSPAQVKLLLDINVRTVEELAEANEETLMRIGMGGRALKEKAKIWLETSRDQGKVSQEIEQLRVENAELKARDTERDEQLRKLQQTVDALAATQPQEA